MSRRNEIAYRRLERRASVASLAVPGRAGRLKRVGEAYAVLISRQRSAQTALSDEGVALDLWKIAMRPGKPLMFGRRETTRYLGLPGNPVASLVCSHLFLKPLLARLGGRPFRADVRHAYLGAPMPANDLRQDYVLSTLTSEAGRLTATPFAVQDSSMLHLLARTDALIVRAPHEPPGQAGDACSVLILRPEAVPAGGAPG